MSSCTEHQSPIKADHPLAPPTTLMSEAPAPRAAPTCADEASPARASAPAQGATLPTKEELLAPRAPETRNASNPVLLVGIRGFVGSIFKQLHAQLPQTLAALAEPPPAADQSAASKLIGFLAETATGLVLGGVSSAFAVATKKALGELTVEPIKGAIKTTSKGVSDVTLATSLGAGVPGNDSLPAAPGDGGFANPAARTLLEEFQTRQFNRLTVAEADAALTLASAAEHLPSFAHADLERLLIELRASAAGVGDHISARFSDQITVGWMNLAATLGLDSARAPASAADGAGGPAGAGGGHEMAAWRNVRHGIVEVSVHLPEVLAGTKGLTLGDITVPTSPGTARMLKRMELPLMALPVYRRITLVQGGQGKLGRDPAVIIGPDGTIEADLANEQLAAMGSGAETPIEDTRGRFGATFSPSLRAALALNGAHRTAAWLASVNSSVIK